jgi:hypothetical protein
MRFAYGSFVSLISIVIRFGRSCVSFVVSFSRWISIDRENNNDVIRRNETTRHSRIIQNQDSVGYIGLQHDHLVGYSTRSNRIVHVPTMTRMNIFIAIVIIAHGNEQEQCRRRSTGSTHDFCVTRSID